MNRHPELGTIDRTRVLRFVFDGQEYSGHPGDTLASALLANGVRRVGTSPVLGRPRGIFSAGVEEPNAVVQIEAPFPEPMVLATTVDLYDGLVARSLAGRGRLADQPDPARYDAVYAHCDVLVIGAGRAGVAAALEAERSGARVIIADSKPVTAEGLRAPTRMSGSPGYSPLSGAVYAGDSSRRTGAKNVSGIPLSAPAEPRKLGAPTEPTNLSGLAEPRKLGALAEPTEVSGPTEPPEVGGLVGAGIRVLGRTTVVGYYDDNYLVAVERRTGHLGFGASPGVARERVWRIRAKRVVLATGALERPIAFAGNDLPGVMLAGAAREYLVRFGVLPGRRAVVFTTNDSAYAAALELAGAGVAVAAIVDSRRVPGEEWVSRAQAAGIEVLAGYFVTEARGCDELASVVVSPREASGVDFSSQELSADLLLVSGGWNPVVHLFSQSGGTLRYDESLGALVPDGSPQAVEVVGAARGDIDHGGEVLWFVPADDYSRHFVDLQRDVTVADIWRATGAGLTSVEHVKRYTTAGTAHDQGKTSGALTAALVAHAIGVTPGEVGSTTFRAPYLPVSFATLAGRDRGDLHDPVRITALHQWHADHGALFENVGQWKRPWYYPQNGEDMETAVLRECRAARENVAAMDASTLGKIDVIGPDAAEFLDRLYTNLISSLAVGSIRYGMMCRPDGMVFDDGTAIRLADDHFLITTTTGNAAAVLDWMEEWLQTEWPDLRVTCTSVTEQWATVALVGPGSRAVLRDLAPALAVDKTSFPFMTWRDTEVAGIPARVCRISFSGELAYEINVSAWYGLALWEALMSRNITPYGTETMHVLRAEKGYPIIGQDTDGTTTPQDLGMTWIISKKKPDFLGKRSFTRQDTSRPDRRHLVALLPLNPTTHLPEGAALLADNKMVGHITSSYTSATLNRTFALALVTGSHPTLTTLNGTKANVTTPVLYDPEGTRRDGNPDEEARHDTDTVDETGAGDSPPRTSDRTSGSPGYSPLSDAVYAGDGSRRTGAKSDSGSLSGFQGPETHPPAPEPSPATQTEPGAAPAHLPAFERSAATQTEPGGARAHLPAFERSAATQTEPGAAPERSAAMQAEPATTPPHPPAPERRSPLDGFFAEFDGVSVREVPFLEQVNVRSGEPLTPANAAVTDGETVTVWLGPDEWLVVGPSEVRGVDVSAQRTAIRVSGGRARELLAHGCGLDLHPEVFPVGRCAQTLLARAQIILIAESDGFLVLVRASFARYLAAWLLDAASEF
ncbi:2Fe-2S iron-sulfur cluster-binding protein [Acrocarpospora macrocephala]|uniref:2Fe-2S iron-sulfur cluster-binding protein n=1 Tax=Acrocarpospora macrocephala TaxID=150177 RepID=UPI0035A25E6C